MAQVKIKVNDKIPENLYFGVLNDNEEEPRKIDSSEVFKGKKVVLFGIPGAFTSVCSSKHLPQFVQNYDKLKAKGVDSIICTAVNDPYVLREWAKAHNVGSKVMMLSDGEMSFHSALGLTQRLPFAGERGLRFSMFVDDYVVKLLNVEEPGALNYKISGPEHMLKQLEELEKK
ncbi:4389_t:CDS:2 [Cetraspora pellucida]|uniref:Thioredoxin-dependent peroxiredoxin n=1 Tax=Cetraspora pellucida TaxID=1433469 RepID=A0A9N9EI34_9GLOM|nr:4389_t:CDS:2 [Cetraspora pellucida]